MPISPPRSIILCSGQAVAAFLDSLISCDLPKQSMMNYGFLLNSKGRVISDFFIWCYDNNHYLLDCPAQNSDHLSQELLSRSFDQNVKFSLPEQLHIESSAQQNNHGWSLQDIRDPALGWRTVLEGIPPIPDHHYDQRRMAMGIPEGADDFPYQEALPLEYGSEKLQAISFDKGCFIGQEVCTRMHRIQSSKFIILPYNPAEFAQIGRIIYNQNDQKTAEIIAVNPFGFFARIHQERMKAATQLFTEGQTPILITAIKQPWRD